MEENTVDTQQRLRDIVHEWNKIVFQEKRIEEHRQALGIHIAEYKEARNQLFLQALTERNLKYCTYRKHSVTGIVRLIYLDYEYEFKVRGLEDSRRANRSLNFMCEHCIEEIQRKLACNSDRETYFFFTAAVERQGKYYWFAPDGGESEVDPKTCVFPNVTISEALAKEYGLPPEIALPLEPKYLKIDNTFHRDIIDTATI